MSYGLQVLDSSGNYILNISDRTPRLIAIGSVTVPSGENTTTTNTVSGAVAGAIAITDSGAPAAVTSANTVVVYGTYDSSYSTNVKILAF